MARGRKRSRPEDAAPAGGSLLQPLASEQLEARAQEDGTGPADAPQEGLDRREDMAALARRLSFAQEVLRIQKSSAGAELVHACLAGHDPIYMRIGHVPELVILHAGVQLILPTTRLMKVMGMETSCMLEAKRYLASPQMYQDGSLAMVKLA